MVKKRIGDFLIEKGLLDPTQLGAVLEFSKKNKLRLGDACVQMGLVRIEDLRKVFGTHYETDFYHLEPASFPPQTADLFPTAFLLQHGFLPLGVDSVRRWWKTSKLLKVGLLNPDNKTAITAIRAPLAQVTAPGSFDGVKIFLVVAEQFQQILTTAYGFTEKKIKTVDESAIDPTFRDYLKRKKAEP